jgi:hypothetical protein
MRQLVDRRAREPLEVAHKLRQTRVTTTRHVYGHLMASPDERLDELLEQRSPICTAQKWTS